MPKPLSHPSLADRLLGDRAEPADSALRERASCCGRLAAETVGREAELDRLVAKYGHGQDRDPEAFGNWLVRHSAAFSLKPAELGLSVPAGLDDETAGISRLLAADTHRVFSPGDICPDNNLLTPDGLRMPDFEGASFHSVIPAGECAYVDADMHDPDAILAEAAKTLDFCPPVAVMLVAALPYAGDDAEVSRIVPEKMTRRDHAGVTRLFDGFDLVEPGVTRTAKWQPDSAGECGLNRGMITVLQCRHERDTDTVRVGGRPGRDCAHDQLLLRPGRA